MKPDDRELDDEIRGHLALEIKERIDRGEDPEAARLAALREFGYLPAVRESMRQVWYSRWIDALHDQVSDVRYALRSLARNPLFALTVVGVLTVGIALNAAVFTMLKSMALTPIAGVDGSARLVVIFGETGGGRPVRLSYTDYLHLRDNDRAFASLFGSAPARAHVGRGRGARPIWTELVTGNYFDALDVRAQLGRALRPSDEAAQASEPVVVIGDRLWRQDLGADPHVVGKPIVINNTLLTVVGVAEPAFHGTTVVYDVEAFIPVTAAPRLGFTFGTQQTTAAGILGDSLATVFYPQGYLRPGTSMATARAQAQALWAPLAAERTTPQDVQRLRVVPFWQTPGGAPSYILPTLTVLSSMGLLVLLIACANVAGLVLVRGISRRGEIAVRLALGASRTRIVRLLLVENLVLAVPGIVLGTLAARAGLPVLVEYAQWLAAPERLFFNVELDGLVIGFAVLIACGSAIVSGFVPALRSSRVDLVTTINEDASPRGASRGRLRSALVVAQVAVSLLLLVGAGLTTRSVEAARRADTGFDPTGVVSIAIDVRQNGYDEARGRAFHRMLLDQMRADVALDSVTLAAHAPLQMQDTRVYRIEIDGYAPRHDEDLAFMANMVGTDYFRTLRIPMRAGRAFDDRDDADGASVAIVNETFATRYLGGPNMAVDRRLRLGTGEWRTIVGVAADLKYARINESPRPYFYLPLQQAYQPGVVVHARVHSDIPGDVNAAAALERAVEHARARIAALDADLPVLYARTMADQIRGAFIFLDLAATMLFIFGVTGMVLAGLGTYGLVSYAVQQSTHEIGIRIALGASSRSVVVRFLLRGLALGLTGAALGLAAAVGVSGLLRAVLFGVSTTDAGAFSTALAIVLTGVAVATLVPAWRAARTSPLQALRQQ
ncbi:MAG TPA: ADOP family duplicated permease [Vicinamibacterales bacterium]|nr:ADOP family duplicated permease [Vicinamibacterales bacterium]